MLIDLSCPVENRGVTVRTNSETGKNYILLKLFNIGEKPITSVKLSVNAFDENGTELFTLPVELDELFALPGEAFAENKAISLDSDTDAKNFLIEINGATFEDGEVYEPSEESTVDCDDSEASLQDALELRQIVPEAVCFSKEHETYWRCVCGRPNFSDSQTCVRCKREKDTVLKSFSSKSALELTIKEIEEEEARKSLEEEIAKKEKKDKLLKNLFKAGIALVSLVVLLIVAFFVRNIVLNIQATKAVEDGDFLKAYNLYSKTGSKKIAELTNEVAGNSATNLIGGATFFTEDEENIYFITPGDMTESGKLIKENKNSKEQTILTDNVSNFLNVVGDYVYFLDKEGQKPSRISKDGKTFETLIDSKSTYMLVVGSDIYYVKTVYDNPKGFTDEECEILASQGQIEQYSQLNKYNILSKKNIRISDEEMLYFYIYDDRIYYMSSMDEEDTWNMSNLKSMSTNGKDIRTVIDVPINSFFIKDNVLYYLSCFDESLKGKEVNDVSALNYSVVSYDLETGKKATVSGANDFVMDIKLSGDLIVMVCYDREGFLTYYSGEDEMAAIPTCELKTYNTNSGERSSIAVADVSLINTGSKDIFALLSRGTMVRLNNDGTDFRMINTDGSDFSETAVSEEE